MSVAKTLLRWRDNLAICGWNKQVTLPGSVRLNTLAEIDYYYPDEGVAALMSKLTSRILLMETGDVAVPHTFKNLIIEIPCQLDLLPDYVKPLLKSLQGLGTIIDEKADDNISSPATINEIHFSQQWKAEAWLSQLQPKGETM
jgi:hypothetical protein